MPGVRDTTGLFKNLLHRPPLLPNSAARQLRVPGYLVMVLLIVQPLIDLYIRSSPFRIHSPAWRLSLVGSMSAAIAAPILGLFFLLVIAVAADDKAVTYAVSSLSALAAVVCVGATGLFALDALQMKNQVQANLAESYGLASAWVGVKLILSIIALVTIALGALRSVKGTTQSTSKSAGKSSSVLVGNSRPGVVVRPAVDAESR